MKDYDINTRIEDIVDFENEEAVVEILEKEYNEDKTAILIKQKVQYKKTGEIREITGGVPIIWDKGKSDD